MTEGARVGAPIRYCYDDQAEPARSKNLDLGGHIALVTATIPVAGPPPAPWLTLRQRVSELQAALGSNRLAQRLTAAVLDGADPLGIDVLLSAAVSERATNIRADIASDVHVQALARLHEYYAPVAETRYAAIAARFDTIATKFTDLTEMIDVEAPAEQVLAASTQAQQAYKLAPALAAELDALIPALCAAAELAGAPPASQRPCFEIPLTCDTTDANRRALWLAWHQLRETREPSTVLTLQAMVTPPQEPVASRCGRWSLLVAAGAVLRACPTPESLALLEPPRARFIQYTDESGRRLNPPKVIDPEGEAKRPGAFKRLVGALAGRRTPAEDVDILTTVPPAAQEVPGGQD